MKTTQFISKWQSLLPEANRSEFALDVYKFLTSEKTAKPSKKTLYTDTVEITVPTLIEVRRAFRALEENENSYIYKVFSDDHVFEAMAEIDKTHKDYFGEEAQPETATPNPKQPQAVNLNSTATALRRCFGRWWRVGEMNIGKMI